MKFEVDEYLNKQTLMIFSILTFDWPDIIQYGYDVLP